MKMIKETLSLVTSLYEINVVIARIDAHNFYNFQVQVHHLRNNCDYFSVGKDTESRGSTMRENYITDFGVLNARHAQLFLIFTIITFLRLLVITNETLRLEVGRGSATR